MKLTAAILSAIIGCSVAYKGDDFYRAEFEAWKAKHGKRYGAEVYQRFSAFVENYELVEQHNKEADMGLHSFRLEMNHLADLTNEEYRAQLLNFQSNGGHPNARYTVSAEDSEPDSKDWRDTTGVVGPVKDQGQCGSCWSFSAVAAMEGRYGLDTGSYTAFSEQELVDCTMDGAYTCTMGGEMHDGIEEIAKNHGGKINTEDQYPYTAKSRGTCNAKDSTAIDAGITGYANVTAGDEGALKTATANYPVISVGIDASAFKFQLYSSGVYDNKKCKNAYDELDHGVAVVGYGATDEGVEYWTVRNSWGASWGQDGYILMSRNKDNQCGIATDSCFALSD